MSMTVNEQEFRERIAELVKIAQSGTDVIVEVPGARSVKLVAGDSATTPPTGFREWKVGLHPGRMVMSVSFNDEITDEDFLKGNF